MGHAVAASSCGAEQPSEVEHRVECMSSFLARSGSRFLRAAHANTQVGLKRRRENEDQHSRQSYRYFLQNREYRILLGQAYRPIWILLELIRKDRFRMAYTTRYRHHAT